MHGYMSHHATRRRHFPSCRGSHPEHQHHRAITQDAICNITLNFLLLACMRKLQLSRRRTLHNITTVDLYELTLPRPMPSTSDPTKSNGRNASLQSKSTVRYAILGSRDHTDVLMYCNRYDPLITTIWRTFQGLAVTEQILAATTPGEGLNGQNLQQFQDTCRSLTLP